jgi:hypothetical protein
VDSAANHSSTNGVTFLTSNPFKMILAFDPAQPSPGGGLNLNLDVSLWVTGRIQVSTDLVHWMALTNFVSTNSLLRFRDPTAAATSLDRRFYRAVTP